jgi:hypothetical protein
VFELFRRRRRKNLANHPSFFGALFILPPKLLVNQWFEPDRLVLVTVDPEPLEPVASALADRNADPRCPRLKFFLYLGLGVADFDDCNPLADGELAWTNFTL